MLVHIEGDRAFPFAMLFCVPGVFWKTLRMVAAGQRLLPVICGNRNWPTWAGIQIRQGEEYGSAIIIEVQLDSEVGSSVVSRATHVRCRQLSDYLCNAAAVMFCAIH